MLDRGKVLIHELKSCMSVSSQIKNGWFLVASKTDCILHFASSVRVSVL